MRCLRLQVMPSGKGQQDQFAGLTSRYRRSTCTTRQRWLRIRVISIEMKSPSVIRDLGLFPF